ncbi:MAG: winged helix-turn-helix transcriptional regulator [Maritimibacter sp.]|nr:winged helix-turn-helix transcriptional regulator [Maritimibacter sp.]
MVQDLKIEALSAPPAYQVVSREIRKLILSGSLQPGEPFPSELSLAEKLGVNRSTVREGSVSSKPTGWSGVRDAGDFSCRSRTRRRSRRAPPMPWSCHALRSSNSGRCVVRSNRFRRDWRQSTGQKINWFRCGQT